MINNILPKNHFFFLAADEISQLCSPLKKLGITYLTYLKNFKDGRQVYLSNSARWIKDYYSLTLYKSSLFEKKPDSYFSGCYIWPKEDNSPVFLHGRDYFDSDNGITIIKKNQTNCEFYFFSGSVKSTWLNNFYLNNIDLLEKFIVYFQESGKQIIKNAHKNCIKLITHKKIDSLSNIDDKHIIYNTESHLRKDFLNEIKLTDFSKSELEGILSKRESEVATYLLQGKIALEIAKTMAISKRTVKTHIANIKIKLNSSNKVDLIKQLLILKRFERY